MWERDAVIVNTGPDASTADGRLRRGEAKRAQILGAALRVIQHNGVGGATQRAVAAEANTSPTLIAYHFGTVENMLAEALVMANDQYLAHARAAIDSGTDPLGALADLIAESVDESAHLSVAEFELSLQAGRDPRIRGALEAWWGAVDEMMAPAVADPARRRVLILAADGMFLRQVVPGQVMGRDEILEVLRFVAGGSEAS